MADNIYLESKEKLFKQFPHYSVREKRIGRAFGDRRSIALRGGVPLSYDAERDIIAIDSSDTHTLIWGSTGSLKTRCVIMPTVKIIGKSGESMIINDPKAEIFNRCADELQENGYKIVVINIRDPEYGDAWNPLAIPYKFYLEGDLDRASEFANDIAFNLTMEEKVTDDPFWNHSASDCLFGLILLLFRYCKDHQLDESYVNMSNLMELRRQLFKGGIRAQNAPLWKYAAEDELVAASLSGSIYAPNETMHSILSTFDQKMRAFAIRPTLLDMLANNDIDIADIAENKVAVFLIIPDEKNTYNAMVSLFIKQAYEYLIFKASNNEDLKLHNRVNFILDEFSSLPPISSMSSLISAARSRDIRFVLAVQGAHQLKKRYGDEAETIKSNCVNWIYLTSRELDLLKEISQLCGEQRNHSPNISVYDLQHFSKEKCEALVLCGRLKPAKVNLLDIDRFGDDSYSILDFEKKTRQNRSKTKFELDKSIISRVSPLLANNPFEQANTPSLRPVDPPASPAKKAPDVLSEILPVGPNGKRSIATDKLDSLIDGVDSTIEELRKKKKAKAAKASSGSSDNISKEEA